MVPPHGGQAGTNEQTVPRPKLPETIETKKARVELYEPEVMHNQISRVEVNSHELSQPMGKDVQNQAPPVVEAPMSCLTAMLDPFTYTLPDKQTLNTPILDYEPIENTHPPLLLTNIEKNLTGTAVEGDAKHPKEIKQHSEQDLIHYQNMDGHKHLRGNTTWTPVMKRGRHSSVKTHRSVSGHKKNDKKSRPDKSSAASSSTTHPTSK